MNASGLSSPFSASSRTCCSSWHPIDETQLQSLVGAELPAAIEHLLGAGRTDELDQALHVGERITQAQARGRNPKRASVLASRRSQRSARSSPPPMQ